MEMLVLSKGSDNFEATWEAFDPARTVRYHGEGWDPDRTDVDVLVMEDVGEDDVRAVVTQPVWKGLKGARIKAFQLPDQVMAMLVTEGAFAHLTHLDLHACYRVGDFTAASLARSAPDLRTLCVDWSDVTDAGLAVLVRDGGPPLECLRGLHLERVTEGGLLAVHRSRLPNGWLSAPAASEDADAQAMEEPADVPAVSAVELGEDSLSWGDFPAEAVFDNEAWDQPWPNLSVDQIVALDRSFDVFRYQKQDPSAEELVRLLTAPLMRGVRYLDLRRNHRMGDEDLAQAIRAADLGGVALMSVDSCYDVGPQTFAAIVEHLPNLEGLEVGSTRLDDAALERLAALPALRVLQGWFMERQLTRDAVAAFQEARPDVRVRFTWG